MVGRSEDVSWTFEFLVGNHATVVNIIDCACAERACNECDECACVEVACAKCA